MTTLSDLLTAQTSDEIAAALLAALQDRDLPTTDWNEVAPERAFVEIFALALAERDAVTPQIAGGVLLEHDACRGAWLTLVAYEFYRLTRNPATRTVRRARLTNASGSAYTIPLDTFWMRGTATGNLYQTSDVGVGAVPGGGGTLDIEITSEDTAAVDADGTITDIATPKPGLTGTDYQPAFSSVVRVGSGTGTVTPSGTVAAHSWRVLITLAGGLGVGKYKVSKDGGATYGAELTIPGGGIAGPDADGLVLTFAGAFVFSDTYRFTSPGSSVITQGTAEESDSALKARCRARWPSLNSVRAAATLTAYEGLARDASAEVTRAKAVTSTTINARVDIYIAGQAGPVAADLVNAVQAYVDTRVPVTARPVVSSAATLTINLLGTLTVTAGTRDAVLAAAQAAMGEYLNSSIPLGGGVVRWAQVLEILMAPAGAVDVSGLTVNGAAVNLTCAANQVPQWTESLATVLTVVEV